MKKTLITLLLLTSCIFGAFAYTDNFYSTSTDPLYLEIIASVKNNESESKVMDGYNRYISSDQYTDVEKTRIEYHISRYFKDNKKKDEAREHVALMREKIDALDKSTITDFESQVLEVEYMSSKYYVDKKMSDGMTNSDLTKKLAESYPDDVFSILTNAWRLIYTPAIAGGSPKKAMKSIETLLKEYGDKLSPVDEYSSYAAIAVAANMRDDYQKADKYFEKAFKFYTKEADIVEKYNQNKEELKKLS